MTEEKLRATLKEAQAKEQQGLLIWANWHVWDDLAFDTQPGNKNYDFALSQISRDEEATVSVSWNSLTMPGFIAISVHKLSSSDEFLNHVLEICEKNHYKGPITLIPLNEISKSF